jgi:hypothetical protein
MLAKDFGPNFVERQRGEVPRIYLLRIWVDNDDPRPFFMVRLFAFTKLK